MPLAFILFPAALSPLFKVKTEIYWIALNITCAHSISEPRLLFAYNQEPAFIHVLRRLNQHHHNYSIATGNLLGFLLLGGVGSDCVWCWAGHEDTGMMRGMLEGGSAQSQGMGSHECTSHSLEVTSRHNLFPFEAFYWALF